MNVWKYILKLKEKYYKKVSLKKERTLRNSEIKNMKNYNFAW
jgi:hypothetical protein